MQLHAVKKFNIIYQKAKNQKFTITIINISSNKYSSDQAVLISPDHMPEPAQSSFSYFPSIGAILNETCLVRETKSMQIRLFACSSGQKDVMKADKEYDKEY